MTTEETLEILNLKDKRVEEVETNKENVRCFHPESKAGIIKCAVDGDVDTFTIDRNWVRKI